MANRYYVDSLAYDFDMFMPSREKQNNIIQLESKKPVKAKTRVKAQREARVAVGVRFSTIAVILALFAAVACTIYLRGEINETQTEITRMKNRIEIAQSEYTSLEMELENHISYKNLEQTAIGMGMQKVEKSQINYIITNEENKAEVMTKGGVFTVQKDE